MNKRNVAVLYGGVSTEHEISKISAANIIAGIPEEKYNIIPVYITREGSWLLYDGGVDNIRNIRWDKLGTQAVLSCDRENGGLLRIVGEKVKTIPVDVVFPALHGKNGEDGTVQGLLELSGIPYVGCGVLASALSFDKSFTKIIVSQLGINQAPHITLTDGDLAGEAGLEQKLKNIRYKIGYPCFVKPARSGSSIGISRAENKKRLKEAVMHALEFDGKIIVEKEIKGRELECAVLGAPGHKMQASQVGEIIANADFYDFEAKYSPESKSQTLVHADIPDEISEKIRQESLEIFKAVDGFGLARADFFWDEQSGRVIFNEINTMPGFTQISMFERLWEQEGIQLPDILDMLIEMADMRTYRAEAETGAARQRGQGVDRQE